MIFRLVLENIRFRPMRTLLSVLLIGVPVMLILTLVGISQGFIDDSKARARGVGADIIVRPPGSSFTSLTGSPMSEKMVAFFAAQPHVTQATGIMQYSEGGLFNFMTGIDFDAFNRMSGGFTYVKGDASQAFRQPRQILVDTTYAAEHHLKPGSVAKLAGTQWTVAGVVEPGKLSHLFTRIDELQEVLGQRGVSQIYLKVDSESNIDSVEKSLQDRLKDYPILKMTQWISLTSADNIPAVKVFINVVVGIGVVIGFAVVSLSMYMAVLQRTREIGILKSLGATKAFVMGLILWEAGAMGVGGTIAGIALSFGSRAALRLLVPSSLPQAIVPTWWPIVAGIAIGAAFLGALYPGMLAVRQDPIEALAYE